MKQLFFLFRTLAVVFVPYASVAQVSEPPLPFISSVLVYSSLEGSVLTDIPFCDEATGKMDLEFRPRSRKCIFVNALLFGLTRMVSRRWENWGVSSNCCPDEFTEAEITVVYNEQVLGKHTIRRRSDGEESNLETTGFEGKDEWEYSSFEKLIYEISVGRYRRLEWNNRNDLFKYDVVFDKLEIVVGGSELVLGELEFIKAHLLKIRSTNMAYGSSSDASRVASEARDFLIKSMDMGYRGAALRLAKNQKLNHAIRVVERDAYSGNKTNSTSGIGGLSEDVFGELYAERLAPIIAAEVVIGRYGYRISNGLLKEEVILGPNPYALERALNAVLVRNVGNARAVSRIIPFPEFGALSNYSCDETWCYAGPNRLLRFRFVTRGWPQCHEVSNAEFECSFLFRYAIQYTNLDIGGVHQNILQSMMASTLMTGTAVFERNDNIWALVGAISIN